MILSCGESLIDMLPRQSNAGEDAFAPYPGGAPFNTAIALGRLGVPTGFISGISSDLFGEILQTSLHDSKVVTDFAPVSDRPTTLAFVKLIDGHATYTFYDENSAGRMLSTDDLPDLPDEVQALIFGCISLVAEPCGSFYEALMAREAARRVMVIDPNIRTSFISDEAPYRARIERMIALADIVKMSDEDLAWLGITGSIDQQARSILAKGPRLVCVTEGAKGAQAFTDNHAVSVPSEKVKVADTVGAGDTFNAGLLASLYRGGVLTKKSLSVLTENQLFEALSLGVRAAAVTVSRAGANPPWASEL